MTISRSYDAPFCKYEGFLIHFYPFSYFVSFYILYNLFQLNFSPDISPRLISKISFHKNVA